LKLAFPKASNKRSVSNLAVDDTEIGSWARIPFGCSVSFIDYCTKLESTLRPYNAPKLMIFVSFGALSALKTRQISRFFIDLARYRLFFGNIISRIVYV